MTKLIAETAWHHEGDFKFMRDLVDNICQNTSAHVVKMHITMDLDSYMSKDHESYETIRSWMLTEEQWTHLINIVRNSNKELMLLLNDESAIKFASKHDPEMVELHSVCLNVPRLQQAILKYIDPATKIVIGVGGCSVSEIDLAIKKFHDRNLVLMFGFQNYPTKYQDVNLLKIRKIQKRYPQHEFGYADHTAWNEKNNEMITLMVASNDMNYVEKHLTIKYGEERCDYSAAISFDQFNQLFQKLEILNQLNGNGSLKLNIAEEKYSKFGPMKMAAVAIRNLKIGDTFLENSVDFIRTSQVTNISQVEIIESYGKIINRNITKGEVLKKECFSENEN